MDAGTTYTIGRFADLSGVTAKTLRFYERIGLLTPASVDARTRYRRYAPEQLPQLAAILALRELGIPLAEVKPLVRRRGDASARRSVLERAREELAAALERSRSSLAWVEAGLEDLARPQGSLPIVLRKARGLAVASLRSELEAYGDIEEVERALRAEEPEGLRGSQAGVVWHRCAHAGVPDGEAFVELRAPLPPRSRVQVGRLPGVTVACAYTDGGEAATEEAFAALHRWAALRGYRPTCTSREIYRAPLLEVQLCVEPAA